MRILMVADGRSPNTRRWLSSLLQLGYEVRLISSYPCSRPPGVTDFEVIPLAFSQLAGHDLTSPSGKTKKISSRDLLRRMVTRFRPLFLAGRYLMGPLSLQRQAKRFVYKVEENPPDLVHALRIPYEGMLAAYTPKSIPFAVSIWGNDLTLHGKGSAWMTSMTMRCLVRADALIADTRRDIRLGYLWGFSTLRPTLVAPGSGGIDLSEINQARPSPSNNMGVSLPAGVPLIVNPRGSRPGSVRNDVFFQAIHLVLRQKPEAFFVCPSMDGQPEALRWIKRLGINNQVRLMPLLPQEQLWELFLHAQVFASPSQHDGTPNSLLEAMSCGCFPIAGDIESLREWITPGVNGLLIDPTSPVALAEAIVTALDAPQLRYRAKEINAAIIQQRAEAGLVRQSIDTFYHQVA